MAVYRKIPQSLKLIENKTIVTDFEKGGGVLKYPYPKYLLLLKDVLLSSTKKSFTKNFPTAVYILSNTL